MKNKLFPFSIAFIFAIIFIVFYKGLKDTNIYTPESKINYEIIYIDDGSKDNSWDKILEISTNNSKIQGYKFLKNYGTK